MDHVPEASLVQRLLAQEEVYIEMEDVSHKEKEEDIALVNFS